MIWGILLCLSFGLCLPTNSKSFSLQHLRNSSSGRRILVIDDEFVSEASELASNLSLPKSSELSCNLEVFSHALRFVPIQHSDKVSTYALAIETLDDNQYKNLSKRRKTKRKPGSSPFYVDLCPQKSSRMGKRGSYGSGTDLLVKAVAPRKLCSEDRDGAVIYDLTAGFGQDSLVLAMNGASKIYMVEQDTIVAALLNDALRRLKIQSTNRPTSAAKESVQLAESLSGKLSLQIGDGSEVARNMMKSKDLLPADVVYLDPMFPPRTKSSAVKKGMQILQGLLHSQQADDEGVMQRLTQERGLLDVALSTARSRVVVKRPLKSEPLGGHCNNPLPSYSLEGSVNRWDVYLINHLGFSTKILSI